MAVATFKSGSPRMVPYTAGADIAAGDVIVTDGTPRIAHDSIANGALGHLAAAGGVYEMTGDDTIDADVPVYWDASTDKFSEDDDSGTNTFLGFTVTACADDGEPALVRHEPQAPPAS